MPSFPTPPARATSFTSLSVNSPGVPPPGNLLDTEFDRTNGAIVQLMLALETSIFTDGSLLPAAVATAGGATQGNLGGGTANLADAPSALSAALAQAWAEYLPGTLPASTLAGTAITGDHWSARYWANSCASMIAAQQAGIMSQVQALWLQVNGTGIIGGINFDGGTF